MDPKIFLLADDDHDDRELFCEALTSTDKTIVCTAAENGEEILIKLNGLTRNPDLIFLDINMPVMDGWQCLKIIKDHNQYGKIPVIMISTSSHRRERDIAQHLGALGYITKPNDYTDLKEILTTIVLTVHDGLSDALHRLQMKSSYIFMLQQ